jgi:hypothetical protein
MIRRCDDRDFEFIWTIINDGAQAYKGIIPADRWTEPYMSREKLQYEIDDGVVFWGFEETGTIIGVMGIQEVQNVTLIRHAYVRTGNQKHGIGGHLLSHLRELTSGPVLIGTWRTRLGQSTFTRDTVFKWLVSKKKTGCSQSTGPYPNARSKPLWY